ncbi:uncharacterized protein N7484_008032 [Penicillium longicatenatum]|uniref:uncharacterized protein n=1 Tax=Penicillium longicatenatum TaxID=1561947 RepID=UPI0025482CC3|nr:uncharacterized protein N7484_008032 [Penicillium longicatenatum]KAJ5640170.1 hypothetical protein N7484_008032 [Penicillium longicatenatum]
MSYKDMRRQWWQPMLKSYFSTKSSFISLVDRFKIPLDLTAMPMIENFMGRQAELDSLWQYLKPIDP